jgi:hypothetical protein
MDITMTTPKHHRSPGSSVSSTEAGCKKHDARNTPERGNTKDNTVSPETTISPINLPPQIEKKTGSQNTSVTSYKDTLTNHTTNKEESDWDKSSEAPSYNNLPYPPTETLIILPRTQKLSTNILTS